MSWLLGMRATHEGCLCGFLGARIWAGWWGRYLQPNCLIFKQMLMSTATQRHLNSNLKMLSLDAKSKDMFVVVFRVHPFVLSLSLSLILRFSDPFLQFSARIKAFVLSHAYLMSHAFQCIFSGQFSLFFK